VTSLRAEWVSRPWGRLRVRRGGAGAPLLAVHGLGGSGRYWGRLAEEVGDRFEVVAPDLAGFGASGKPSEATYDLAFHLADLDAALGEADRRVFVVGHSIGAVVAAFWAAGHEERVAGLALLAAPFPTGGGEDAWMREGTPPRGAALVMRAFRIAIPMLSLPVGVARRYPPGIALDYGRQSLLGRARTTWWTLHDPGVTLALEAAARSLANVPSLLVHAADDRTVGIREQERWAAALPWAERVTIPRGGHQFLLREGGAEPLARWLDATLRA
jgi:pimeloyl-ACP methyl ester carboxylesterase